MQCDRVNYRFFITTMIRNGFDAPVIHQYLVNAWGQQESPSLSTVYRLISEVKSGARSSFEDSSRCGRPSTASSERNVSLIQEMVAGDPSISIRALSDTLDISSSSVHAILHDKLGLRSLCAKWIPKDLSPEQKECRVTVAKQLLSFFTSGFDPRNIIYVDEKWFYLRSVGTKSSNKTWCASAADKRKIARRSQSDLKCHVIMAATFGGQHYFEIMPHNENINGEAYIAFLEHMHHKFIHVSSHTIGWKNACLIHDNARPHVSRLVNEFLERKRLRCIRQSPYSPDYNLEDFWLFSKLENMRQKRNFSSESELEVFLLEALSSIDSIDFLHQFEKLKLHFQNVIDASGDYL